MTLQNLPEGRQPLFLWLEDGRGQRDHTRRSAAIYLYDPTPPRVIAEPVVPPNANGWYNTGVTVRFLGEDELSGVASCSPAVTVDGVKSAEHGQTLARAQDCSACHPSAERMTQIESQDCLQCHTAKIARRSERVRFPHDGHYDFGFKCSLRHANVNQLSHLYFMTTERRVDRLRHDFCALCHAQELPPQGSNCAKCHIQ